MESCDNQRPNLQNHRKLDKYNMIENIPGGGFRGQSQSDGRGGVGVKVNRTGGENLKHTSGGGANRIKI